MGHVLTLEPDPVAAPDTHYLNELQAARRALIKDRVRARNHLSIQREAMTRKLTQARMALLDEQIAEIDDALDAQLKQCAQRAQALACISSIKGIGVVSARAILTEMPEIGTLTA